MSVKARAGLPRRGWWPDCSQHFELNNDTCGILASACVTQAQTDVAGHSSLISTRQGIAQQSASTVGRLQQSVSNTRQRLPQSAQLVNSTEGVDATAQKQTKAKLQEPCTVQQSSAKASKACQGCDSPPQRPRTPVSADSNVVTARRSPQTSRPRSSAETSNSVESSTHKQEHVSSDQQRCEATANLMQPLAARMRTGSKPSVVMYAAVFLNHASVKELRERCVELMAQLPFRLCCTGTVAGRGTDCWCFWFC